jgi:hypothetical protein
MEMSVAADVLVQDGGYISSDVEEDPQSLGSSTSTLGYEDISPAAREVPPAVQESDPQTTSGARRPAEQVPLGQPEPKRARLMEPQPSTSFTSTAAPSPVWEPHSVTQVHTRTSQTGVQKVISYNFILSEGQNIGTQTMLGSNELDAVQHVIAACRGVPAGLSETIEEEGDVIITPTVNM